MYLQVSVTMNVGATTRKRHKKTRIVRVLYDDVQWTDRSEASTSYTIKGRGPNLGYSMNFYIVVKPM